MSFLFVALGGFIGSILRFYISLRFNKHLLGTLLANVTGSIFLAFMMTFYLHGVISENIWLFSGIGFSGAYTTFSTFSNETMTMLRNAQYWQATSYVVSSLGSAILCVYLVFAFF